MAGYKRKYANPADRLAAQKKPKTEEHKKAISDAQKRYWAEARRLAEEREQKETA